MRDGQTTPLAIRGGAVGYGERTIIPEADLALETGTITALVGPNGCGKSTLLRALGRLLRPSGGSILLDGREIRRLSSREVARRLGVLPQSRETPEGISVRDLVAHGRYPHLGILRQPTPEDHEAVDRAIGLAGLDHLADRDVATLSGGERQRAWLALALAQETGILLLDEPTTYLDVRYQLEILELVRRLNREQGLTVLWVLHDLNHAAEYSDRIVLLRQGRILADGTPCEVLTPEHVRAAFDVEMLVQPHPLTGAPFCIPLPPGTPPPTKATSAAVGIPAVQGA